MEPNVSYKFSVTHAINFDLFEKKSAATSTYEAAFKQVKSNDFRIEVKRSDFKVNDKEIETKFESVAYEYNKALFPVLFDVIDGSFSLANYNEIAARIELTDAELRFKHDGPGFQYIRNQFLENVSKDGYTMSQHFFSFGLMKVIMLCLQETEKYEDYQFQWEIIPLETTLFCDGNTVFSSEQNVLQYSGQANSTNALFDQITAYGIRNKFIQEPTEAQAFITTTITNKTQFINTKLDFEFSETEVKINNSHFNYQEKLAVRRKF